MAYYSKLSPSDAGSIGGQPNFGEEVGIGNGKVAVGAPLADEGSTLNRGAVYVYDLDGTNEVKITPSAYANVAIQFGQNVSIGSNKILVGSMADACFLYDLDGTNEVVIDPGYSNSNFGSDKQGIKIYGDKIYISDSNLASNVRSQVGAVYIYRLSDQALLKVVRPSDTYLDPDSLDTAFGYSIDVKDDILVVGAPQTGEGGSTGKVYVYDLDGNNERILEASDGVTGDYLGWKVAIDGGRIIASARLWHPSRDGETSGSGAAYSWYYDGTDERMFRQLNKYNSETLGDAFSEDSLVAGGGRVYVGARNFETVGKQGSVFSYTIGGRGEYNFQSSDVNASSGDNYSFAMDYDDANGYLVVTARYADSVVGAAYVYEVAPVSGNVKNLTGAENTSSMSGVTYKDGCIEFNGVDSEFIPPNELVGFAANQEFTLEAWVNTSNFTPNDGDLTARVIGLDLGGLKGDIAIFNSGRARFRGGGAAGVPNESVTDPDPMNLNQWYHLVCTYSNGRLVTGYRDGSSVGTYDHDPATNPAPALPNSMSVEVGRYQSGGNSFVYTGKIAQIRVYKRALSAAEVLQNFNATRGKYGV